MPFVTINASNTGHQWLPPAIDCYHAVKVKNAVVVLANNQGTAQSIVLGIGFDEVVVPSTDLPDSQSFINIWWEAAADESITFALNGLDRIIGDSVHVITSSANGIANVVLFYDVINTSFDQYGQAVKTLRRTLQ